MSRKLLLALAGLVGLALPTLAMAQETASGVKDFRGYVFGAYTAAFVILFALLGFLFGRQNRITDEVEALRERLEKTAGAPDS